MLNLYSKCQADLSTVYLISDLLVFIRGMCSLIGGRGGGSIISNGAIADGLNISLFNKKALENE